MKALLLAAILLAHDWYPRECCNGNDCIQIPCEQINPATGEWNGKRPLSLRHSPDGKCHICVGAGGRGSFYCAFTPDVTS